jgi:DNA-binding LacI/PurR family transcriptional regulator
VAQKVSLKQVAAHVGLSYQLVSNVLNKRVVVPKQTEQRILDAVRELGYRPNQIARNMRLSRSCMIGYSWAQSKSDQANFILDQFLTSMVQEAEAAGYHLLPFPFREGNELVEAYQELIQTGRADGFVISSVNYDDPRISFLLERKFPFVAFGRSNPELDFPYVDVDGYDGIRQVMAHLLSRGHQRIAAIAWPEDSRVGNERMRGYFESMQAAGVKVHPAWVERGEGTFEFGRAAAGRLLKLPVADRPTAIIALNDTQAIGALHAAREQGLVIGRNLAIVGFDDAPMSQYLHPALTTVRQPIHEAGRKCVEILVALMKGEEPLQRHVLLAPELVLRASA